MNNRRSILTFIVVGLAVAFPGEFANNFLVMNNLGNFVFAMVFYTLSLSFVFFITKKFVSKLTTTSLTLYMVLTGIGWGLVLNEWIIVGNHPLNPSSSAAISQISMIAFHMLVYTIPLVVMHMTDAHQWLRKIARGAALWFTIIVFVGQYLRMTSSGDTLLAWTIMTTYFLGYLPVAVYVVYRIYKDVAKHHG